jgi:hypothetical protein
MSTHFNQRMIGQRLEQFTSYFRLYCLMSFFTRTGVCAFLLSEFHLLTLTCNSLPNSLVNNLYVPVSAHALAPHSAYTVILKLYYNR